MAKFIGKHNFPKSILEHEENKNRGISIKKKKSWEICQRASPKAEGSEFPGNF